MVKRGSKSFSANKLADTGLVMADMVRKMLEMEKEIGRLRHHVSVLSKREVGLRRELKGMERKEEVASEVAEGKVEVEVVAVEVATAPQEAEGGVAGGVESGSEGSVVGWDVSMTDLRSRYSDEDVVVGGKIVPLKGYEPGVEVAEVGSSTVVPVAPRAIQVLREREVGHGAPAGPRAQLARGRGMGPIRGRGRTGFGPSGNPLGITGGFYARGPGRGWGRGG